MKNLILGLSLFTSVLIIASCSDKRTEQHKEQENSALNEIVAPTFNLNTSDSQAVALADQVIAAHGGEEAWNKTRYISWNFLGRRDLVWDKYTGLVRITYPQEESVYIIDIKEDTGRVKIKNSFVEEPDSLAYYVDRGKQIWVNDSYWLIFPFKLKDPGVQLRYLGMDTTTNGKQAEVISLSFTEVGYTPENKYYAYVDPSTKLILQWDYFSNFNDTIPGLSSEWSDYQKYGGILLSSGRGERQLSNISVSKSIDSLIFKF